MTRPDSVLPNLLHRRSLTYHIHAPIEYIERNNAAVVQHYSTADTIQQVRCCSLLDLSEIVRTGLRGPKTENFLANINVPFPERANQCQQMDNGMLVARLGSTECWLLDNPLTPTNIASPVTNQSAHPIYNWEHAIHNDSGVYSINCQHSHAWFALTGDQLPPLMAKICGVDLRASAFPLGAIAQTSIARVNAIIIHHQLHGISVFSILSDCTSAEYLWHAISDAMAEFRGKAVGLNAFAIEP